MDRKETIYKLLLAASEKGFLQLFETHKEHFYYCSLVMMDCATPCITALSEEVYRQLLDDNADGNSSSEEDKAYFRWAYAESPYLGFGYEEYFQEVNAFFCKDVSLDLSNDEYDEHVRDWVQAMRVVMKSLKDKGIFSKNCKENVFLFAEQQPPEPDNNLKSAHYLNEEDVFKIWYQDNKEEYM